MGIATSREDLAASASASADWTVTDAGDYKRFEFFITTTGSWSFVVEGRDDSDDAWAAISDVTGTTINATSDTIQVVTSARQVQLSGTRTGGNCDAYVVKSDSHPLRW